MRTGLSELHKGCCHFQNSGMISEEEPVPKQRSPYVPGSPVESGFKMLFSKLFYFSAPFVTVSRLLD